jgi:hypothetical protein
MECISIGFSHHTVRVSIDFRSIVLEFITDKFKTS